VARNRSEDLTAESTSDESESFEACVLVDIVALLKVSLGVVVLRTKRTWRRKFKKGDDVVTKSDQYVDCWTRTDIPFACRSVEGFVLAVKGLSESLL